MSEQQTTSFWEALDEWTKEVIIEPLVWACGSNNQERYLKAVGDAQAAIRQRIRDSYRSGCRGGAKFARRQLGQPGSQY